jgi:hypothetical protein
MKISTQQSAEDYDPEELSQESVGFVVEISSKEIELIKIFRRNMKSSKKSGITKNRRILRLQEINEFERHTSDLPDSRCIGFSVSLSVLQNKCVWRIQTFEEK